MERGNPFTYKFFSLFPPESANDSTATENSANKALPPGWRCGAIPSYEEFVAAGHAGKVYGKGILRFLSMATSPSLLEWNKPDGWPSGWEEWSPRLFVFAYDWWGRQFAFDHAHRDPATGEPMIAMLETNEGKILHIPHTFEGFVEIILVDFHEAALGSGMYQKWLDSGGKQPAFDECVGFKIPLFLGGGDEVKNLEISPISVYVSITGQLFSQVRDLPVGTPITGVTFGD